jgi:hypothetical protein
MTYAFTTIDDLAALLGDVLLGLDDSERIREAIRANRALFGRYEDIDADMLDTLARAVWWSGRSERGLREGKP